MTRKLDVQKVETALRRAANDAKTGPREGRQMGGVQSSNSRQLAVFANPCHPSSMATRNINLPDALDRFVAEKVSSGSYQNASEVVRAGLRLLPVEGEGG